MSTQDLTSLLEAVATQQSDAASTFRWVDKVGLEKEALRVAQDGRISQMDHPQALGSALTHPFITTDYSEALMEMVTEPYSTSEETLDRLTKVLAFVHQNLDQEITWNASMPCILQGEKDIRIAEYGESNLGQVKHIYRRGLAVRYGKMMQVIAGVHFNVSMAEPLKQLVSAHYQRPTDEQYMAMARNVLRYGWIVPYFMGCSPAICQSFLEGEAAPDVLVTDNGGTYYGPYATSLRLGDRGYTNKIVDSDGALACYNSLEGYTKRLNEATHKKNQDYTAYGVKQEDGTYNQLNDYLLQIENELYSSVRPKAQPQGEERPIEALRRSGIRYMELRSVDVNMFEPLGVSLEQMHFLEIFSVYCYMQESAEFDTMAQVRMQANLIKVAHEGRKPGLMLARQHQDVAFSSWAQEVLDGMLSIAESMDQTTGSADYVAAMHHHQQMLDDVEKTPSARALAAVKAHGSYFEAASHYSQKHFEQHVENTLPEDELEQMHGAAKESLTQQHTLDTASGMSLDEYISRYYQ